ncbi:hypothetical protein BJX76DRAFT_262369 [Aspergillus varians]
MGFYSTPGKESAGPITSRPLLYIFNHVDGTKPVQRPEADLLRDSQLRSQGISQGIPPDTIISTPGYSFHKDPRYFHARWQHLESHPASPRRRGATSANASTHS